MWKALGMLIHQGPSFPRTSPINKLHEVSLIADDESDLDFSTDCEHVALPQVQLSSALVHGRNIGDSNLDALDGSVNGGTGEVTSETNNIRSPSLVNGVRLQNRATENRPNRPVIVASIRKERIRTRAGVLRQTHSALKLRGNQPVRKIAVSDRNGLKRSSKVLNGVRSVNGLLRRVGENIKVRTGRSAVNNSRVELAAQSRGETASKFRIQGRQVTTELVRERLNDRQLVRGHALRADGRVRDRLLVSLIDPVSFSVSGDHRDSHATAGK